MKNNYSCWWSEGSRADSSPSSVVCSGPLGPLKKSFENRLCIFVFYRRLRHRQIVRKVATRISQMAQNTIGPNMSSTEITKCFVYALQTVASGKNSRIGVELKIFIDNIRRDYTWMQMNEQASPSKGLSQLRRISNIRCINEINNSKHP